MHQIRQWRKEPGARLQGSRDLDSAKLQAPCIVALPGGGYRLFYTAVGPAKPYPACQGYILSAISADGLRFRPEPGIRLAPDSRVPHRSLRLIAPTVVPLADGRWRMYVESRGPANQPTVIASAVSADLLDWEHEDGIRLACQGGVGGPRYCRLSDGRGRLYFFRSEFGPGGPVRGPRLSQSVVSAMTTDGVQFELEPGYRLRDGHDEFDAVGITGAEVLPPATSSDAWTMYYSAWQDVPAGSEVPLHPSADPDAVASGKSDDFAAASIAADMAGYRSRIFVAHSTDGLAWERAGCAIEGAGYGSEGIDAVHAEDMSLTRIGERKPGAPEKLRMYYAACDNNGVWRIASAVAET